MHLEQIRQQWDIICRLATDADKPGFASALTACRVLQFDGQTLQLEVPIMYRALFAEGHSDRVFFESLLQQCTGQAVQLQIHTGGISDDHSDADNSTEQQRMRLYKQAQRHPVMQLFLDTFDADIVAREPLARETWLKQFKPNEEQN